MLQIIKSLPQKGNIYFDSNTNYWYIKLSEQWQKQSSHIAALSSKYCQDTDEYASATALCKRWSMMIINGDDGKDDNIEQPAINCVTPPSIAGLYEFVHVSFSLVLFTSHF